MFLTAGRKKLVLVVSLLAFFLVCFLARFYDLTLDPISYNEYGIAYVDEGGYVNNARNKVLFGTWKIEEDPWLWNSMYISPIFTYLEYLSFKSLGVSTITMRLVPALMGVISIMVASFFLMRRNGKTGLIYLILLGINTMLIIYSRIATLQSMVLFFILIILGFIINDKKWSWFATGFLLPALIFSNLTSIFFIAAIPLSLLLYYWLYRQKETILKLCCVIAGAILSSLLWLVWFLPNFQGWWIMNFSIGHRIYFNVYKLMAVIQHFLKFSFLNQLVTVIAIFSLVLIIRDLLKKKKVFFMDLFLTTCIFLFLLQASTVDFFLRRWVFLLPIILLISARFIAKIKEFNFSFRNKPFKFSQNTAVILLIVIYIAFSIAPLAEHFGQSINNYNQSHIVYTNSKELNMFLPPGTPVFSNIATAMSYENKIKPYFIYEKNRYIDYEEKILPYLTSQKVDYALLREDLCNENDLKKGTIDLTKQIAHRYIRDNFKIVKTWNSKDWASGGLYMKMHLYQRVSDPNWKPCR